MSIPFQEEEYMMNSLPTTSSAAAPVPALRRWLPLPVLVTLFGACTDRSPQVCGSIPRQNLFVGESTELKHCFQDPEGETLTLSARSSDAETAAVVLSTTTITIRALDAGDAIVTVTAADPAGQMASVDIDVRIEGPPRLLGEDFDEGLGDWTPNSFTVASASDGMVRFRNTAPRYFGVLEHGAVNAVDWIYKAALGNDTGRTVAGLLASNAGQPAAYFMAVGRGFTLDSIGDSNYRLLVCCEYFSEDSWWGRSDAVAHEGELTELTLSVREGELKALAGSTELLTVDLDARGWPQTIEVARIALWPEGGDTWREAFVDRVDLWGHRESAAADWHKGPPDIPEFLTTGQPWVRWRWR